MKACRGLGDGDWVAEGRRAVRLSAGKLRTRNSRKHEWVLKEDSVTYGDKATLKAALIRDFADEREYDYGGKSPAKIIPHFARFIARVWQAHPFGEGNTRTTAVFAIKYLRSLGCGAARGRKSAKVQSVVDDRYQKLDRKLDRIEGKLDKLLEIANRPLSDGMRRAE